MSKGGRTRITVNNVLMRKKEVCNCTADLSTKHNGELLRKARKGDSAAYHSRTRGSSSTGNEAGNLDRLYILRAVVNKMKEVNDAIWQVGITAWLTARP